MSRWLALAEGGDVATYTAPDSMTKPDKTPAIQPEGAFCQVLSGCQLEERKEPAPPDTGDMRHGFAINGHPRTWTGKVVSLDAWRHLSDWERHGPDGRMWCGITKQWINAEGLDYGKR